MNIIYERDVSHCDITSYVREVTVWEIKPAINSDNLETIKFKEVGWNVVTQKGLHEVGKKVMFIPAESVLPLELSELLGVTNYLSKSKVRVVKLRGNRSEGLIVDTAKVLPYLYHIMKWEDPPSKTMSGNAMPMSEVNPHFHKFLKMENILNSPTIFEEGECIYISEKIHGTNFRIGKLPHPATGLYQIYIGSHNVVLKHEPETVYSRIAKTLEDKLPKDIVFFGEVYGKGIQHLDYGVDLDVRMFAASRSGDYLPVKTVIDICTRHDIPFVKHIIAAFNDLEQIRYFAEADSLYTDKHEREGVVIVSREYPERMVKCISFDYLAGQPGKKRKRTERH